MEYARDLAQQMQADGKGVVLNQFGNTDNPLGHYESTGPELWYAYSCARSESLGATHSTSAASREQTAGKITHFVSSMGTTGTIMGASSYLKDKNPGIQIVGLQPADGAKIAGIRRWPEEYLPTFFDASKVDVTLDITQAEAEETMRALARVEGVFAGVSSGGAVSGALRLNQELQNAVICVIICDRGDRYLSTGVYDIERLKAQVSFPFAAYSRLLVNFPRFLCEMAHCLQPEPVALSTFWAAQQTLQGLPKPLILFVGDDQEESGESWYEC